MDEGMSSFAELGEAAIIDCETTVLDPATDRAVTVAALPAFTHHASSIVNPAAIHVTRTANSSRTKVPRRRGSLLRQSLGPVHAPVAPNALNGELCVEALEDVLAHSGYVPALPRPCSRHLLAS